MNVRIFFFIPEEVETINLTL